MATELKDVLGLDMHKIIILETVFSMELEAAAIPFSSENYHTIIRCFYKAINKLDPSYYQKEIKQFEIEYKMQDKITKNVLRRIRLRDEIYSMLRRGIKTITEDELWKRFDITEKDKAVKRNIKKVLRMLNVKNDNGVYVLSDYKDA